MRIFRASLCLLVLLSLFHGRVGLGQGTPPSTQLTDEHWREDLRTLADAIREKHRAPFHQVNRQDFNAAVDHLDGRIPELEQHEIIAELARLVALVEDGHTRLTLPVSHDQLGLSQGHSVDPTTSPGVDLLHVLPLRLFFYEDGLFVRETMPEQSALVGLRVVGIGTKTAEEALAAIRPYIAAENDSAFRLVAPTRLVIPEMLAAAGIVTDPATVHFAFEGAAGQRVERELTALSLEAESEWIHVRDLNGTPAPLRSKHPDAWYWFEHLPAEDAVYVQLNRIGSHPEESLPQFVERLFALVNEKAIDRIVLDLRHNGGGNGYLNRTLVLALIRWEDATRPGHLYVITGRSTFSAAIQLSTTLEQYTQAIFVGEKPGGKPNHYGDSRKTLLPNSGLTLRTSTVYWRDWTVEEQRESIVLDLPIPLTSRDDATGHDSALAAALGHELAPDLVKQLVTLDKQSGLDSAALALFRLLTDPDASSPRVTEDAKAFASHLLQQGRKNEARSMFGLIADIFPADTQAQAMVESLATNEAR